MEALLIMPLMILCLVMFIQVGQHMHRALIEKNIQTHTENLKSPMQPADWIRKTDLLLDRGRGLSSLLPGWS